MEKLVHTPEGELKSDNNIYTTVGNVFHLTDEAVRRLRKKQGFPYRVTHSSALDTVNAKALDEGKVFLSANGDRRVFDTKDLVLISLPEELKA